jgi:hypothetical protein
VDGPGLSNGFTHDEEGIRDILSLGRSHPLSFYLGSYVEKGGYGRDLFSRIVLGVKNLQTSIYSNSLVQAVR